MTAELKRKLGLVRAAMERIKQAEARYREVEADPSADSIERAVARQFLAGAEREFGRQWRNVEALLGEAKWDEVPCETRHPRTSETP